MRLQVSARVSGTVFWLFVLAAMAPWGHCADTLNRATLAKMDAEITHAIAQGRLPGGVLWLEHQGERYVKAYGERAVKPASEPMIQPGITCSSPKKV